VLHQLRDDQVLAPELVEAAEQESLALPVRPRAFGAPHFVAALMQGAMSRLQPALSEQILKQATRLRTTIDPLLQHAGETALASAIHELRLHRVTSGAVLVLDNATGDVLAYVGSPDFYDEANHGQVDAVRALRQPGSTLKPFVYATAFEELGYTPATVLPDLALRIETNGGAYSPRNFDDKFRGPVRLREALGNSLNVPAVHTAMRVGTAPLLEALRRLEFTSLRESPDYYGPALALGDGEVTLVELTRAYATLARGGRSIPLRVVSDVTLAESVGSGLRDKALGLAPGESRRVLSEANAALITDILKDKAARSATFGVQSALEFDFEVAAKTGTSKGFRDNWVVGYSSRITVGVWVGNWDGSPMREVSGISGAGPIFRAIMLAAHSTRLDDGLPLQRFESNSMRAHRFGVERVEICPVSGMLRGPHCPHGVLEYLPSKSDPPLCDWHRQVHIDNRNGLLAGPNCPATFAVARSFELFPEEYSSWAASVGRPQMPTEASPECPIGVLPSSTDELTIVRPHFGSRFVIDPERTPAQQALQVEGAAPRSVQICDFLVDEKLVATKTRPFEFFWVLAPGHHRLQLRTKTLLSAVVEIDVRRSDGPQ
jgi:penicillin-binding protein 1C